MLDKVLHNRWPRVGAALFGSLLLALAINLFIVPQHLYSSGLLGLCQVIRTLLDTKLGIRFDNFTTKQDSVTVCEVIITGVFKRPALPSLKPYAVMQLADDRSNEAACTAFLTAEESKPGA